MQHSGTGTGTGTGIGIGISIGIGIGKGIGKGIGIGIGKGKGIGIGIGTDKGIGIGIGIGMPKMLLLLCFLNEIVKSLEKPRVFEGQDDGLRCGRIAQPRATWGGMAGSSQMPKMLFLQCFLNEIVKSLEKPCVFEGQDEGLRCGRIAQPRATWGGPRACM